MEEWENGNIKERISCAEDIWRHATRAAERNVRAQVQGSFLWQNLLSGLIPYRS